jgi:hypothetical protein
MFFSFFIIFPPLAISSVAGANLYQTKDICP